MKSQRIEFQKILENNGSLSIFESAKNIPFNIKRIFSVFTKKGAVRGNHAHKKCHQFLICLKGKIEIKVDEGTIKSFILTDNETHGIHIPPLVWASQHSLTDDNILMVIASHNYDEDDYIRDFNEFKKYIKI